VCNALGAGSVGWLVASVTAFTLGHALALAATLGLFGAFAGIPETGQVWAQKATLGGLAALSSLWVVQRGLLSV